MHPLLMWAAISAAIIGTFSIANWVVRPLEQTAKHRRCPTQFTLSDLLGLFVLLPVSMSLAYFGLPSDDPTVYRTFGIVGWFVLSLIWWYGVRSLSRAGVRNPRHRVLFLVLVIPVTLLAAAALLFAIVSVVTTLYSPNPADSAIACGVTLVLLAVLYALGRLTRRLIASTPDRSTKAVKPVSEIEPLHESASGLDPENPTPPEYP